MLAGIAAGVYRDAGEAVSHFVKTDRVFEPDPVRHKIYQQKLESYRELFPLLRDFLAKQERAVVTKKTL